jgi:hypothetical protein
MANVPTQEFQKLWSNLIEYLRLEYKNTIQHPDWDAVMEHECKVLIAITRLVGCTPASVSESLKLIPIIENMAQTWRNIHQLLKGKKLHSALYGVYTEVLCKMAVLKDSAARGETAKTTIIPRGIPRAKKMEAETYRQRRQKSQQAYNIHHGSQLPSLMVEARSPHLKLLHPLGQLKWKLTTETMWMTLLSVSNSRSHPAR